MPVVQIRWDSLLNLTELEFVPEAPKVLKLSDEMIQTISWLTGATGHDRKLLRCNQFGALLVGNAWDNLGAVEVEELEPAGSSPKTYTAGVANKGVRVSTGSKLVLVDFYQEDTADYERMYLASNVDYFYPHKIFKIIIAAVPYDSGDASFVGITAYN